MATDERVLPYHLVHGVIRPQCKHSDTRFHIECVLLGDKKPVLLLYVTNEFVESDS